MKELDAQLQNLDANGNDLWGSKLAALEFAYVLNDLKNCCIAFVNGPNLSRLKDLCSQKKLSMTVADYKVRSCGERQKGGFSNASERVPADSPDGNSPVFISKDRLSARLAGQFYKIGDNQNLARLLGYPDCCSTFFQSNLAEARKCKMDFIKYAATDCGQHEFYTNRALRYFDIALISHFPCSLRCLPSREIGKARYDFLSRESPQIAQYFEESLRSFVLYTDTHGVFYSNQYQIQDGEVTFQDIHGTVENELSASLRASHSVQFRSATDFQVGDTQYDRDCCLLFFR